MAIFYEILMICSGENAMDCALTTTQSVTSAVLDRTRRESMVSSESSVGPDLNFICFSFFHSLSLLLSPFSVLEGLRAILSDSVTKSI